MFKHIWQLGFDEGFLNQEYCFTKFGLKFIEKIKEQ
jgi:hypothetical protein